MPVTQGQGNPDWTREETILALDVLLTQWPSIPGRESTSVKELSKLIQRLPIHWAAPTTDRFRNPAGVSMKLQNLASLHPDLAGRKGLRTSEMDRSTWKAYAHRPNDVRSLAAEIAKGIGVLEAIDTRDHADAFSAEEGEVLMRVHKTRERHSGVRPRVLARVKRTCGCVACEACGCRADKMGFEAAVAEAVFELHHLVPLCSVVTTRTTLVDVVLLCANCHRLIHAAMRDTDAPLSLDVFRDRLRLGAQTGGSR